MSQVTNKWQRALSDGRPWLVVSVLMGAVGLICGFLGMMVGGLGMGGSGCSSSCMDTVHTFASIGLLFMGSTIATTLASIGVIWVIQTPALKTWKSVFLTAVNLFVVLVAGLGCAFLVGFL